MHQAMAEGLHGARRPRPVADVPPPALADGRVAAKSWLVALVAATPLQAVGALPTAQLAAQAPGLCAAMLRAVGSDRELDRLHAGGDAAPLAAMTGRLAGAPDAAAVAGVVGLLRSALWEALADEVDRTDGELVAALATRLAHVCDVVTAAALGAGGGAGGDERSAGAEPAASPGAPVDDPPRREGPIGVVTDEAPRSLQALPDPAADVVARRGADAEPWHDAVAARLQRHAQDGEPFAVLAVEVDDAQRLLAADTDGEALRAITWAEAGVRRAARGADAVVREHPGRLWMVVPVTGPAEARSLGERLADAAATVALRETPLTVSIGFATVPEDGTDAAALIAHADEGVFAARAAGVRLA
jgi:GGDEF domain-containing protein